ncbi:phosphoserine phosphatase SerB [Candidatus Nitrosotenuis cloacae]|uniref:phosphoserine phosphatase SerB n=1 Tax=Candidatus Nitrosotenuis cloacae TaxID=1603555 RepID=UPI00210FBDE4|nr:phosphoserine phosphatase SerB [Candidatus Nitrosotenuis cloacae]
MDRFSCKKQKKLLAIFDVEGVLFDAEYLPILAEKINKQDEIWAITKKGIQGLINWEDGLRTRVEALRGLSYETCKEVADELPIMTGAKETCRVLKAAGWKIMAVSGGFTIMTDRLKEELGLDYVYSNELLFKDGKLDGVNIHVTSDKAKSARVKIGEWKESKDDIVVTVDGANDLTLFDICGLGVAFRAQDIVKDKANVTIEEKNLTNLIPIINKKYNLNLELQTVA